MRLQDRPRTAAPAPGWRSAVEDARAQAGAAGAGRVDAARPGKREEVGEAGPGLGVPRGSLVEKGEGGDEGGSGPEVGGCEYWMGVWSGWSGLGLGAGG